jgi:hypothetical protein
MTIKLRSVIKHPALVEGENGISIEKESGVYTYGLDLTSLAAAAAIPNHDAANLLLVTEGATDDDPDVYEIISVSDFSAAIAALADAFVGDSGSGGTQGLVPAPAAGDAALNKFLHSDGTWKEPSGAGLGDVSSPGTSTDNAIARFDGLTGNVVQNSAVTIDDNGSIVASAAHHAFGVSAIAPYVGMRLTMNFTSNGGSNFVLGVDCDPTLVLAPGDTGYAAYLGVAGFGITTPGSAEVFDLITAVRFAEPQINVGAGDTVTKAATVFIYNAPTEGVTNAALWVESGNVLFQNGYFNASQGGTTLAGGANTHGLFKGADHAAEALVIRHSGATATNQYGMVAYLTGDPNNTSNYFYNAVGNATSRFMARSNGGLANFSANNVNLSDAGVKTNIRPYTETELDALSGALERVDWGVWKYADQTHDDLNHGPTAQGVRYAFKGIADELVDEWNERAGDGLLAIYSHDLTQIAIASLVHQNKRVRGELAELKNLIKK